MSTIRHNLCIHQAVKDSAGQTVYSKIQLRLFYPTADTNLQILTKLNTRESHLDLYTNSFELFFGKHLTDVCRRPFSNQIHAKDMSQALFLLPESPDTTCMKILNKYTLLFGIEIID